MDGEDIGSTLVLAALGLIGTVVTAVFVGWIAIQVGLGQIVAIGAGFVAAAIAVLGFLGFGGQTNETTVNTDVSINQDDLQFQIQQGNLEKETNPNRADFPERSARFLRKLRDRGVEYAMMQNILKSGIVLGVFIMMPFAVALITFALGQIGADIPPEFIAFGEWVVLAIGGYPTMMIATAGMFVAMLSFTGYTELNRIFDTTTCDECSKNFCLLFDYVLYNPETREPDEEEVRDEDGKLQGIRTSGYFYKGTLHTTCTTRNEMMEIEDWNWYVSKK